MTWSCRSEAMRSWSAAWAMTSWSARARASSIATAAWLANENAIRRCVSVNSGLARRRPRISAPRTCSPAVSGTTISGPRSAPSTAVAASRCSPVTRLPSPVRSACPASEPTTGAVVSSRSMASAPLAPVTIIWSEPYGTATTAKSASAAAAACSAIRVWAFSASPDSSSGVSSLDTVSHRRRCSDSVNRRAFAMAAPAAAASAMASSSSSAVNSPPPDRSMR